MIQAGETERTPAINYIDRDGVIAFSTGIQDYLTLNRGAYNFSLLFYNLMRVVKLFVINCVSLEMIFARGRHVGLMGFNNHMIMRTSVLSTFYLFA
jgi:hypothetical protein